MKPSPPFAILFAIAGAFAANLNNDKYRDELLKGVTQVGSTWYDLANIVVFGPNAFGVVGGGNRIGGFQVGVAASTNETTGARIVCYGNDLYTGTIVNDPEFEETGIFLVNAVKWACNNLSPRDCRIGHGTSHHGGSRPIAALLEKNGFQNITQIQDDIGEGVYNYDVLLLKYIYKMTEEGVSVIQKFLTNGGSLVLLETAEPRSINGINKWINPFGLSFALEPTTTPGRISGRVTEQFNTSSIFLEKTYLPEAMQCLREFALEEQEFRHQELATAVGVASSMIKYGPESSSILPDFLKAYNAIKRVAAPNDEINKKYAKLDLQMVNILNAVGREDFVLQHPAHKAFPGGVVENATVTSELVTIRHQHSWQSTGLYAIAGKTITVEVLKDFVEHRPTCRFQIGAHSDNIEGHSTWNRLPRLSTYTDFEFVQGVVHRLNSPFGGNIFIDCPNAPDATPYAPTALVRISSAIKSATFILGDTDVSTWRNTLRYHPAPWGELVHPSKIIFTHAREILENVEDPAELLQVWGEVIDKFLEFTGGKISRAERVVHDIQISVGDAHSGYPIMHSWNGEQLPEFVNVTHFREFGNWGALHEIGHNFQRFVHNPPGFGEVSNNLMAIYVCDTYLNIPRDEWVRCSTNLRNDRLIKTIGNYIENGKIWQNVDAWAGLAMLIQIQELFGWDIYQNSFHQWRLLATPPRTDAERQKLWIVSLSKESQKNLITLFESWGFPVPSDAAEEISHLPSTPHTIDTFLKSLQDRPIVHLPQPIDAVDAEATEFECGNPLINQNS